MKKSLRLALLLLVLAVIGAIKLAGPALRFDGRTLHVTLLVYCDLPSAKACHAAQKTLTCGGEECLGPTVARFYGSEFRRYAHRATRVDVHVVPAVGISRMTLQRPTGLIEALAFYHLVYREFHARSEPYFGLDARLFVNVVSKDPSDRSESSVGSANGRIGLVEWNAAGDRRTQVWNMCKVLHELGHIWGAADHYAESSKSKFPEGYVQPELGAGSTQRYIDIMSGTRPVAHRPLEVDPESVAELRVSPATAVELGWVKAAVSPDSP